MTSVSNDVNATPIQLKLLKQTLLGTLILSYTKARDISSLLFTILLKLEIWSSSSSYSKWICVDTNETSIQNYRSLKGACMRSNALSRSWFHTPNVTTTYTISSEALPSSAYEHSAANMWLKTESDNLLYLLEWNKGYHNMMSTRRSVTFYNI